DTTVLVGIDASKLSNEQLDSLRKIQKQQEAARKKAEKEKRKKERKDRRKERRARPAEMSDGLRMGLNLLTMLKRTTINYSEQGGTTLPGYMDSTQISGMNILNGQPGFDFVYGYQPGRSWLESKGRDGKLSTDSLFNAQFMQQYSQNFTLMTTLEPIKDLRIDLTWNKIGRAS